MNISFDERDEFKRKAVAERVIRLLQADLDLTPLLIDGGWGTGKSVFCHKLIGTINTSHSDEFLPIYVDAYRADHTDQPLLTLLAAILGKLPATSRKSLINGAKGFLAWTLKIGGKAALAHLLKLDQTGLDETLKEALKQTGDAAIDHATALLTAHMAAEKNLETLREALKAAAQDKPVVLFIDELDRCRPDFALQMLETIKHVFDVKLIHIVLIANCQQLQATIAHRYGSEVDAVRYLDKFIRFRFTLPPFFVDQNIQAQASLTHLDGLVAKSLSLQNSKLMEDDYQAFFYQLMQAQQRTLREVETFVRTLEVYHFLSKGDGFGLHVRTLPFMLRVFAVYCHCFFPEIANELRRDNTPWRQIVSSLGRTRLVEAEAHEIGADIDTLLAALALGFDSSLLEEAFKDSERRKAWRTKIQTEHPEDTVVVHYKREVKCPVPGDCKRVF